MSCVVRLLRPSIGAGARLCKADGFSKDREMLRTRAEKYPVLGLSCGSVGS
jgi:hypothetical protein